MRKFCLLFLLMLPACSLMPEFKNSEEVSGGYVIEESLFNRIASKIYKGDRNILGTIYEMADSLSSETGKERTLNLLSDKMADAFFNPDSKFHNDSIYIGILDIEEKCRNFTSDYKRVIAFRKAMISLGKAGRQFPIPLQLGGPAIVLVKGEGCNLCKKLERQVAENATIQQLIDSCKIGYFVLSSLDMPEVMERLDTRLIPSFYLLDSDGTVIVKGATDLSVISEKVRPCIR